MGLLTRPCDNHHCAVGGDVNNDNNNNGDNNGDDRHDDRHDDQHHRDHDGGGEQRKSGQGNGMMQPITDSDENGNHDAFQQSESSRSPSPAAVARAD